MKRYGGLPTRSFEPGEWRKPDGLAPQGDMGAAMFSVKRTRALNIKKKSQHLQRGRGGRSPLSRLRRSGVAMMIVTAIRGVRSGAPDLRCD
jgi:hypothetical protein